METVYWDNNETPVALLQELMMKKNIMPSYTEVFTEGGTDEPIVQIKVTANNFTAIGTGKSKQEAKHEAAIKLLLIFKKEYEDIVRKGVDTETTVQSPLESTVKVNSVGNLNEFCVAKSLNFPEYKLTRHEGLPHARTFYMSCTLTREGPARTLMATGTGKSKQHAKHDAASQLLLILNKEDEDIVRKGVDTETTVQSPSESIVKVNAVGNLNEFCVAKSLNFPEYKLTRHEGLPHARTFYMSCTLLSFTTEGPARTLMATGTGKSKQEAKHDAASKLLLILNKKYEDIVRKEVDTETTVQSPSESIVKVNAVGNLNEFCLAKSLSFPEYKLTKHEGLPHAKIFPMSCTLSSFTTEGTARTLMATGNGKSNQETKQDAASNFKLILNKEDEDIIRKGVDTETTVQSPSESTVEVNAVGTLNEFCLAKSLGLPEYKLTRDEGLPHVKTFYMSCTLSSSSFTTEGFTTEGTSRTKQQAKHLAAQKMLDKLTSVSSNFPEGIHADNTDTLDKSMDKVLKELDRLNIRKPTPITQTHIRVKLENYCCILKDDPKVSQSPTLQSLHNMSDDQLKNIENPDELIKVIFEEVQFDYELKKQDRVKYGIIIYVLLIKSPPRWTIMGQGATKNKALQELYFRTLKFLRDMAK